MAKTVITALPSLFRRSDGTLGELESLSEIEKDELFSFLEKAVSESLKERFITDKSAWKTFVKNLKG